MPIPRYVSEPSAPSWKSYAKKQQQRNVNSLQFQFKYKYYKEKGFSSNDNQSLLVIVVAVLFFFILATCVNLYKLVFFFFSRITHSYIHYLQQLYNPFSRSCYVEDSVIRYSRAFSLSLSAAFKLSWIFSSLKPYSLKVFTNSRNSTAYNNIR